jgi:hypothetical protein
MMQSTASVTKHVQRMHNCRIRVAAAAAAAAAKEQTAAPTTPQRVNTLVQQQR